MTLNYPVAAALSVLIATITFSFAIIGMKLSKAKYLVSSI